MSDNAQEPSMEEILASIRRIISDENPAADAPASPSAAAPAAAPVKNDQSSIDDIFELTDIVEEEPVAPAPAPERPRPAPSMASPVLDDDLTFETRKDDGGILARQTVQRAGAALGELERHLSVVYTPGITVEGLVRELLKPLLKEWLDQHLPDIVETVVRQEVERVARSRR